MKKLTIAAVIIAALGTATTVEASNTSDKVAIGVAGILIGKVIGERRSHRLSHSGYEEYASLGSYGVHSGNWYPYDRGFPSFRCRGDQIQCAYEQGVYERERSAWRADKREAYACGRWGRCK